MKSRMIKMNKVLQFVAPTRDARKRLGLSMEAVIQTFGAFITRAAVSGARALGIVAIDMSEGAAQSHLNRDLLIPAIRAGQSYRLRDDQVVVWLPFDGAILEFVVLENRWGRGFFVREIRLEFGCAESAKPTALTGHFAEQFQDRVPCREALAGVAGKIRTAVAVGSHEPDLRGGQRVVVLFGGVKFRVIFEEGPSGALRVITILPATAMGLEEKRAA